MNIPFDQIKYNDALPCSETSERRHLTVPYCMGNGLDLGSSGCPVVPWAIQIEKVQSPRFGQLINYIGDATNLPFKDETMDFVYASHLLEDFLNWEPILTEWNRVIKPDGYIIIMVPDREIFRAYVHNGNPDNLDHKHESYVGELTEIYKIYFPNFQIVHDYLTDYYNILFVAKKLNSN